MDYRFGVLASVVVNVQLKKDAEAFTPSDFFPSLGGGQEATIPEAQSDDDLSNALDQWAMTLGVKNLDPGAGNTEG